MIQHPGPQWQPQQAPRPEPPRFGAFLGTVLAVVIIVIGLGVLGLIGLAQQHPASDQQPSAPAVTAQAAAPAPASASAATPAPVNTPRVLFQQSGSGELTTAYFTTGPEWQLQWSYDCGSDPKGLFMVVGHDGPDVNVMGATGSNSSWSHNNPGRHYLSIFSTCNWTVRAVG